MEQTEGLGRLAEVWVDGTLLEVCDSVSAAEKRCPPGPMESVEFQYVSQQGFSLADAIRENSSRRREIEHLQRWSYIGYGQIKSIMPVVIDFGILEMIDANWVTDESLVGQFVAVPIDRLELVPRVIPDWPEVIGTFS
jgi:hypothetical protein